MSKVIRWWTAAALLVAWVGVAPAQQINRESLQIVDRGSEGYIVLGDKNGDDKKKKKDDKKDKKSEEGKKDKKPYEKHDAAALYDSLRDVIDTGAKMFNPPYGDHAGCYRLYQGSLLSVKPFLAKGLQAKIDAGIANAEKMHSYADRAFELRRVLDEVRASAKPGGGKTSKTPVVTGGSGQISGKLSYQGKPVAGGYFVTLVAAGGKKFSTAIQKNGAFTFATPIAVGDYRIAIEPIPGETIKGSLPTRYASEATSGLAVFVQAGKQSVDLNLVK